VALALVFCGAGLGLAVPPLSRAALSPERGALGAGLSTVGARHAGLVLALVLIAPLLSHTLETGGQRALLAGTRVVLDGDVPLTKKVPIALDLRDALDQAPKGKVPNLAKPFNKRGASSDARLRRLRDDLIGALETVITRSFRSSFALCVLFALLSIAPVYLRRGRPA
jgi:hypothetical protein